MGILERFSNERRKTKTKALLYPITAGTKHKMNQSEIETSTSN